eukprot:1411220-Amphidinium_carterae.1
MVTGMVLCLLQLLQAAFLSSYQTVWGLRRCLSTHRLTTTRSPLPSQRRCGTTTPLQQPTL